MRLPKQHFSSPAIVVPGLSEEGPESEKHRQPEGRGQAGRGKKLQGAGGLLLETIDNLENPRWYYGRPLASFRSRAGGRPIASEGSSTIFHRADCEGNLIDKLEKETSRTWPWCTSRMFRVGTSPALARFI